MKTAAYHRVLLLGDGLWALKALELLRAHDSLAAVVTRVSPTDHRFPAAMEGVPYPCRSFADINSREALDWIRGVSPDLLLSVSFDQIFRKPLLQLGPPVLNVHAGHPAFVRGRAVLTWQLMEGRRSVDLVLMRVTPGIDCGPVLAGTSVPIAAHAHYGEALDAVSAAVPGLLNGLVGDGRLPQLVHADRPPTAVYYPRRLAGDEWIDWRRPAGELHDFIRALAAPNPGALTRLGDKLIRILRCGPVEQLPPSAGIPGSVVDRSRGKGLLLRCGEHALWLREAQAESGDPFELLGLKRSDRLGAAPQATADGLRERVGRLEQRLCRVEDLLLKCASTPDVNTAGLSC